jgi:3-oxoadipate enol-lactonase
MLCTLPDGNKIFYSISGNPDRKPLVCLNGLSQSTVTWKGLRSLLEPDYRVILLDLIFQGQSDKSAPSRSITQHADDVIAVLDHIGLQKTLLAGISYGSIVSQNILLRYPDRIEQAALLATFGEKTARFRDITVVLQQSLKLGNLDHMIDVLYPLVLGPYFFENPPLPIRQIKDLGLEINDGQSISKLLSALSAEEDYLSRLGAITVKTAVIHGEFDFLCLPYMAKAVADAIPGSNFNLVKNVGHTLNVEAIPQLDSLLRLHFS